MALKGEFIIKGDMAIHLKGEFIIKGADLQRGLCREGRVELENLQVVALMGCGHDGNEEQIVKQSVGCSVVLVSIC